VADLGRACFEMRPPRAGSLPDWLTRGSRPR
jgi:hypothetical protein